MSESETQSQQFQSNYSGFLWIVSEKGLAAEITAQIERDQTFTAALSQADWKPKQREVFILSLEPGWLTHVALAEKTRKVATGTGGIRFTHLARLNNLAFGQISNAVGANFGESHETPFWERSRRLNAYSWSALLKAIELLTPEGLKFIRELLALRAMTPETFTNPAYTTLSMEKDALGVSLSIFGSQGLRASVLGSWEMTAGEPAPFLRGLGAYELREDAQILHDSRIFGEWMPTKTFSIFTEFERGQDKLTVAYANRSKLEETLGVDLIYYHHKYDSFVMVQYKRMIREGTTGFVYRPDLKLRDEIARMQAFEKRCQDSGTCDSLWGYRFHPGPFYLKFCPCEFDPASTSLMEGMYVPLDLWQVLRDSKRLTGPRGGEVMTYDACAGRYLSNTNFTSLIQDGWIGSRQASSKLLQEILRVGVESKRAVIFAASEQQNTSNSRQ